MKKSIQDSWLQNRYHRRSPDAARSAFWDWASLFGSGRFFVNIAAYIDESGTHDRTGTQKGSSSAVMVGLVAWRDEWAEFCAQWQRVLNTYHAPYFHFCEWSAASRVARGYRAKRSFQDNPYKGWPRSKLDGFLLELAEIAGNGNKITVGGWIETAAFHKTKITKGNAPAGGDPYVHLIQQFFAHLVRDVESVWKYWKEPISFIFDQHDDPKWRYAIHEAFCKCQKMEKRFKETVFADKTDPDHLPLQAADMCVYRFRQLAENANNGKLPEVMPLPKLDELLLKGMFRQFDRTGYKWNIID